MAAGGWGASDYTYTFSYDPKGMVLEREYYRSFSRNGGAYHDVIGDYKHGVQTFITGEEWSEENDNINVTKRVVKRKFPKTYLNEIGYEHASGEEE